jgi:hypothetical protein
MIHVTVVAIGDDVVCVVAVVVVPFFVNLVFAAVMKYEPIKRQIITRHYFDGFGCLDVAHDIASHIDGGQVFDWAVVVSSFARRAVVCWGTNAFARALVDAIDVDALHSLVRKVAVEEKKAGLAQMKVCAAAWLARSETAMARGRAIMVVGKTETGVELTDDRFLLGKGGRRLMYAYLGRHRCSASRLQPTVVGVYCVHIPDLPHSGNLCAKWAETTQGREHELCNGRTGQVSEFAFPGTAC